MIRVTLADDHTLVRQGIRLILENADDIEIVGEAENGEEAVDQARKLQPDVLIMDINMPRLNGIQAAEQISNDDLTTQIVILSMHSDETLVRQALEAGVKGYILKRSVTEELLLAVRAAYRGDTFLCSTISNMVVTDFLAGQPAAEPSDGFDRLSPREREILKLIVESYTNKAIAESMNLSIKTVEKHRANLMSKLNAQDLVGLIRIAVKHGLIFFDE
jgi:two-component system response regulator NreC